MKTEKNLYQFSVEPNEQKEVILKVKRETRGLLRGVIVDECGNPLKDAAVKLLELPEIKGGALIPLTHAFTDEYGQFMFGPLCCNKRYAIKVWVNNVCVSHDCAEIGDGGECLRPEPCKKGCHKEECCPRPQLG